MPIQKHRVYVGIDVHSKKHKVAIIHFDQLIRSEPDWRNAKMMDITNSNSDFELLDNTIREYVSNPEEAVITVDHTGGHYSEPIVHFLTCRNYNVYYLEPKGVKAAKERLLDQENKSDTVDAVSTAYLLYLRDIHNMSFRISAIIPDFAGASLALRHMILQRQQYIKMATQATNRLHQFLLAIFPEAEAKYFSTMLRIIPSYPTPDDILKSGGLKGIKYINHDDKEMIVKLAANTVGAPSDPYRDLIADLSWQREKAKARIAYIDDIIAKEVKKHPYGEILFSFPWFGAVAAATIIGIVNDIGRWPDKNKLKKALGVYCTVKQSGTSPGKARRGKEGSKHGRGALFQVVLRLIQNRAPDNDFKDYYHRQVVRGKPRMKAIFSTMGKLAEIIYYCLKNGEFYQYQGKYRH